MKLEQIELREIQMPLVSFFETSFGRTTERRILLVRVFSEGVVGYGEATSPEGPFYNHESTGTAWHILRDFVIPCILQASVQGPADVAAILKPIRGHSMAKAALKLPCGICTPESWKDLCMSFWEGASTVSNVVFRLEFRKPSATS